MFMETGNFRREQFTDDARISDDILEMYKIAGQEKIDYAGYVRSKKRFETEEVHPDNDRGGQHLALKTKNKILDQDNEQSTHLIIDALQNDDIEIQRIGASLVHCAPENQKRALGELVYKKIVAAIHDQNVQIQRIGINMVQFAPEETKADLRKQVLQKITEALNSDDIEVQRIMAKKIDIAPEETQSGLREIVHRKIIVALQGDDIRAKRLAAVMIQYAPSDTQDELRELVKRAFESAKQQGKNSEIIDPFRYPKINPSTDGASVFSRSSFSKTGSEITLLHSKLFKNNLIIRHIEESCFLAWKKAYESYSDWTEAGFDYVPIEPIYSFKYESRTSLVDVASGVLDINLEEWKAFSGNTFAENLDQQKNRITAQLTQLGIHHGHINDANFCLRFDRDENGKPDLTKIPRIYLIDFDKAVS